MDDLTEAFVELIRLTSTDLPADVEKSLVSAREQEAQGSAAVDALDIHHEHAILVRSLSRALR